MPEPLNSEDPQTGAGPNRRIPLPRPGRGETRARLAEILRVDHAGEYGAVKIYEAQAAIFAQAPGKGALAEQMRTMQGQEAVHKARFDALLTEHRVRPTALLPLWSLAATGLGAATALMGEKAAHACTEAVEAVIEQHYADQIAELSEREPELAAELSRFRDEELDHHDHAIEQGSREAPAYRLLSAVIKAGCKVAIKVSERV
jgi:ubiquinone biosynthesis monooxygenase Coq7